MPGKKKTYYPSKTFDDAFTAFAELFGKMKWTFPGIDAKSLTEEATAQRGDRAKLDALNAEQARAYVAFTEAQERRYLLFRKALEAAKAVSRGNNEVTVMLNQFKRSVTRKPAAAPAEK